ncbi:MAG: CHAT domain-containing protein [Leptolyngbya sp. SIO3F4]|nr:CHAT domain-containing protein [Leptolyngbya sp. SIO3F4]
MRRILYLAANPPGTSQLRLGEEARQIREGLERSQERSRFLIEARWAVDDRALRRALLDVEPHIVHFSGHGTGSAKSEVAQPGTRDMGPVFRSSGRSAEGLILEGADGKPKLASSRALANLFSLFPDQIECVLLNACYSEIQADAIHQHVDYVIGMNRAIGDEAAISFAVGFYDALGANRPYDVAYKFGCSAIDFTDLEQSSIPVLKARMKPIDMQDDDAEAMVKPDPNETESTATDIGQTAMDIVLENPEGQVPLASSFYMERPPVETDCYSAVVKPGSLIRVKAARQMGKTSLMSRILAHGVEQGYRSVPVYFQEADGDFFSDLDVFLQWFCGIVAEELEIDTDVDEFWQKGKLGSKRKCTNFFQKCILPEINTPLVLGLDEVDLIFQHLKIAKDFFALLRTWHERGKNQPIWQNLRMVIVHSREVYIPLNMHESPFNVGMPIQLAEFNADQVKDLTLLHGLKLSQKGITSLMKMLGGHPYLTRMALYTLTRGTSLEDFLKVAPTEEGPFSDHLRRHLSNVRNDDALRTALMQVIAKDKPVAIGDNETFQLRSMGLIKVHQNEAVPLCDLYRQYLRARLSDG